MILKQSWDIDINNHFYYSTSKNALFVWNDGMKIFAGSSSGHVKIFNYIPDLGLYDITNYQNVSVVTGQ